MEDNMKEFVAFSRKLLRVLIELRELLEEGEYEKVKSKLDGLIEDCLLYTSPSPRDRG